MGEPDNAVLFDRQLARVLDAGLHLGKMDDGASLNPFQIRGKGDVLVWTASCSVALSPL
jgi:hypothetical protein